ncbi:MAG: hypothetical protein H6742_17165 [Alphaproteobacteria bacterium]|nr:hypothetical protein [Alphaproteobacteria bacterium]
MLPLLVALIPTASAVGDCGTPAVLAALHDAGPVPFAHALTAPARLDGVALPPPPGGGKSIYGSPYSMHIETDNFTVNWWDSSIHRADAEAAADALEVAWNSYVDQGWVAPVSSDRYLLWVLLDPGWAAPPGTRPSTSPTSSARATRSST